MKYFFYKRLNFDFLKKKCQKVLGGLLLNNLTFCLSFLFQILKTKVNYILILFRDNTYFNLTATENSSCTLNYILVSSVNVAILENSTH